MVRFGVLPVAGACVAAAVHAAAPRPGPEVYLAEWTKNGLADVTNVSRNPGFNSQPQFLPDSRALLFASNRDGLQTDIYRYDVKSKALTRLTQSDESEYSPAPAVDGRSFAAVRIEPRGVTRLWTFDADGGNPHVLFEAIRPVGGGLWIDATHVALYVLDARGGPAAIRVADIATGTVDLVESSGGRSLARRPKTSEFSYVTKSADARKPSMVKTYDWKTRTATAIAPVVPGAEDVAWLSDRELFMTTGTTLYRWRLNTDTAWSAVCDLSPSGVANVTRPVVSADGRWVAFVADPATSAGRLDPARPGSSRSW